MLSITLYGATSRFQANIVPGTLVVPQLAAKKTVTARQTPAQDFHRRRARAPGDTDRARRAVAMNSRGLVSATRRPFARSDPYILARATIGSEVLHRARVRCGGRSACGSSLIS